MLRAIIPYLLIVLGIGPGIMVPDYWLNIAQAQERLRQTGAQRTYVVDWRVEGDKREATYWIKPHGLVIISWRTEPCLPEP